MNFKVFSTSIIPANRDNCIALPQAFLQKFPTGEAVIEERDGGLLLTSPHSLTPRKDWEAIFAQESQKENKEDWSEWDVTLSDGLEENTQ